MGKVRKEKKGIKSKKKLIIKKSLGERERNEKKTEMWIVLELMLVLV